MATAQLWTMQEGKFGHSSRNMSWAQCKYCASINFKMPQEFVRHLREKHCSQEGGSFVCRYGDNGVCSSLPVEGVNDKDYEDHVVRHHAERKEPIKKVNGEVSQTSADDRMKWTIYSSSQNLPAVLNDPSRGMQRDFFTKTWGDLFVELSSIPPSPYLPVITANDFDGYLRRTSKRYRRLQKRKNSVTVSDLDNLRHDELFPNLKAARSFERGQAALSSIPRIFLQPSFDLSDPTTFAAVFPFASSGGNEENTSKILCVPSSKLMHEKLTHHLDVVEVAISQQVSKKASSFFQAASSHDCLREQLRQTVELVKKLRSRMQQTDDSLVKDTLHLLRLHRRKQNYLSLHNKLQLMLTVQQTQPTVQLLLSTSDYVGALDLMATTQEVLLQELAGVHAFRHLGSQLAEMGRFVDHMLESEFLRYATADLNRPLQQSSHLLEEEKVIAIVFGMLRQKTFGFLDVYKRETTVTVKAIIKQTVIEAVSALDSADLDSSASSPLDQTRLLPFAEWLQMMNQVLGNLILVLRRVKSMIQVVTEAVDVAAGKDNQSEEGAPRLQMIPATDEVILQPESHAELMTKLQLLLQSTCDFAHERAARIVTTRSKDNFIDRLGCGDFVSLSKSIDNFIDEAELLCGRRSTALRLALQGQATRFIHRFHEERKTKLGLLFDTERWRQADVPSEFQELIDYIQEQSALHLPKRFSGSESPEKKTPPSSVLRVDNEDFAVVGTALLLLKMIVEYCEVSDLLPSMAADLLFRLCELLKQYNSRCCQLVLGAGALKQIGLKTITSTNLALSSRSLQLILQLLPRVQNHYERLLPNSKSSLLRSLQSVHQNYAEHISAIADKLLGIMSSLLEQQVSQWEVKPPVPSNCFKSISRQVGKLHEAVGAILPQNHVSELFVSVQDKFCEYLRAHLLKLNVVNDGGPQHGVVISELTFYMETLKKMNVLPAEMLGAKYMQQIWTAR